MQLICQFCNIEFKADNHTRKYCSRDCYLKAHPRRVVSANCLQCKKTFTLKRPHVPQKYCSYKCRGLADRKNMDKICPQCDQAFTVKQYANKQEYCSQKCRGLADQLRIELNCLACGKTFTLCPSQAQNGRGKYCSRECYYRSDSSKSFIRARQGKRSDLGDIWFRSSWEANYARLLNHFKDWQFIKDWEFEPHTFDVGNAGTYLPDFKVESLNGHIAYHEVKGYMTDKGQSNLDGMAKVHPDVDLLLVNADRYKFLEGVYADTIPNWEFPGDPAQCMN